MTSNNTTARASAASGQRWLTINDWIPGSIMSDARSLPGIQSLIIVRPPSGAMQHRVSLVVCSGAAQITLLPTLAEARELMAALHWALAEADIAAAHQPAPICVELVGEGPV